MIPADASRFKLTVERNEQGGFHGKMETSQGTFTLNKLEFDEAKRALTCA